MSVASVIILEALFFTIVAALLIPLLFKLLHRSNFSRTKSKSRLSRLSKAASYVKSKTVKGKAQEDLLDEKVKENKTGQKHIKPEYLLADDIDCEDLHNILPTDDSDTTQSDLNESDDQTDQIEENNKLKYDSSDLITDAFSEEIINQDFDSTKLPINTTARLIDILKAKISDRDDRIFELAQKLSKLETNHESQIFNLRTQLNDMKAQNEVLYENIDKQNLELEELQHKDELFTLSDVSEKDETKFIDESDSKQNILIVNEDENLISVDQANSTDIDQKSVGSISPSNNLQNKIFDRSPSLIGKDSLEVPLEAISSGARIRSLSDTTHTNIPTFILETSSDDQYAKALSPSSKNSNRKQQPPRRHRFHIDKFTKQYLDHQKQVYDRNLENLKKQISQKNNDIDQLSRSLEILRMRRLTHSSTVTRELIQLRNNYATLKNKFDKKEQALLEMRHEYYNEVQKRRSSLTKDNVDGLGDVHKNDLEKINTTVSALPIRTTSHPFSPINDEYTSKLMQEHFNVQQNLVIKEAAATGHIKTLQRNIEELERMEERKLKQSEDRFNLSQDEEVAADKEQSSDKNEVDGLNEAFDSKTRKISSSLSLHTKASSIRRIRSAENIPTKNLLNQNFPQTQSSQLQLPKHQSHRDLSKAFINTQPKPQQIYSKDDSSSIDLLNSKDLYPLKRTKRSRLIERFERLGEYNDNQNTFKKLSVYAGGPDQKKPRNRFAKQPTQYYLNKRSSNTDDALDTSNFADKEFKFKQADQSEYQEAIAMDTIRTNRISMQQQQLVDSQNFTGETEANELNSHPRHIPLFNAIVTSHNDFLTLLEESSIDELARELRIVVASLADTPIQLDQHRRMAMQIIHERVEVQPFLQQHIYFIQQTEIDKNSFVHHITGLASASILIFREFFKQKRKKGFEYEIPRQATVYHPFRPVLIRKLKVEQVFRSNTRPLLLRLWSSDYSNDHPRSSSLNIAADKVVPKPEKSLTDSKPISIYDALIDSEVSENFDSSTNFLNTPLLSSQLDSNSDSCSKERRFNNTKDSSANSTQIDKVSNNKNTNTESSNIVVDNSSEKFDDDNSDLIIFKNGDDLRRDMAVMAMFKLMNLLQSSEYHYNSGFNTFSSSTKDLEINISKQQKNKSNKSNRSLSSNVNEKKAINNGVEARRQSFKADNNRASIIANIGSENGFVEAFVYDVVAMSESFGAIEFIPNCFPINQVNKLRPLQRQSLKEHRMINTAAGGTIASFILGIKDRHDDNTLIAPDGCMFQIDFSYMLGQKVSIDTAEIAITRDTKRHFGTYGWNKFVQKCIEAFLILRKYDSLLIRFASLIMGPLFTIERVQNYLKQSLMLNMSRQEATKQLSSMLHKAPSSYRTRFKNVLHHTAQAFKKEDTS